MKAGDLRVVIENQNGMPVGGIIRILAKNNGRVLYHYITKEYASRFERSLVHLEIVTRPASKLHKYLLSEEENHAS